MTLPRVAVAMSGGVDSSIAAVVLQEAGYEVIGFTMQIWPPSATPELPAQIAGCCGVDAVDSARRVARALGIRHYVLNLREPFERLVIEPFCDAYEQGLTPNPCIRCNTFVKFGPLLDRAREINAQKIATGHYALVAWHEPSRRWRLSRGKDETKDQSYSLYGLTQEQLSYALFPLGALTKKEVRKRAAELGLATADRPESQEICFISGESYREFIVKHRPNALRPGPIVDLAGRQLGQHRGIAFYTIGQRQGLGLATGRVIYVIDIDAPGNRLIVGERKEAKASTLFMDSVNYVSLASLPSQGLRLTAKIRSTGSPEAVTATPEGKQVKLEFQSPQWAIAPGQAAVCYEGNSVAFGGTIKSVTRKEKEKE